MDADLAQKKSIVTRSNSTLAINCKRLYPAILKSIQKTVDDTSTISDPIQFFHNNTSATATNLNIISQNKNITAITKKLVN